MAISRSNETETSEDNLGGPGKRLREARLAKKLELGDVAARLHLHFTTVERIEADDYENLPAPTFVRGYLRGYARLLDLKPDPILGAYNSNEFDPPPLVRDISNTGEVRSTDISFRLATYLILTVVVVLVAIWWQNQESGTPPGNTTGTSIQPGEEPAQDIRPFAQAKSGLTAEQDESMLSASELGVASDPVTDEPTGTEPDGGMLATPGEPLVDDGSQAPGILPSDEMPTSVMSDQAPEIFPSAEGSSTDEADDNSALSAESSATDVPAADAAAESTTQTDTGAKDSLKIALQAESWVEIYDKNNEKLFYDLGKAGEVIEITANGPFRVLLGNTTNLTVEFNGSPFDIKPHTDAGVARFRLSSRAVDN